MTIQNRIPEPADKIIEEYDARISTILDDTITGVFLTGSIAMNDFYPNKSDIDFIVVCRRLPSQADAAKLLQVHRDMARKFPKPDLSGCYLDEKQLLPNSISKIKTLSFHQGKMRWQGFEMAAISLRELQTNPVTISGALPAGLAELVSEKKLNEFLFENINTYWKNWLIRHSSVFSRRLILFLFPRFTEWVILGVARQICTLLTGRIVSKTEAGKFCMTILPEKFHPVIQQAIAIRNDDRTYPLVKTYAVRPSFSRTRETLDCTWFMIDFFNRRFVEKYG